MAIAGEDLWSWWCAWCLARGVSLSALGRVAGDGFRHGEADLAIALLADQVRRPRDANDVADLRPQRAHQPDHDLVRRNRPLREQLLHERRVDVDLRRRSTRRPPRGRRRGWRR